MAPSSIPLLAVACLALGLAPGPSNLLALRNATVHGFVPTIAAGGGRLAAFAAMLAPAAAGLGAALDAPDALHALLRPAGAAYLLVLSVRAWRAPRGHGPPPARSAFAGFFVFFDLDFRRATGHSNGWHAHAMLRGRAPCQFPSATHGHANLGVAVPPAAQAPSACGVARLARGRLGACPLQRQLDNPLAQPGEGDARLCRRLRH